MLHFIIFSYNRAAQLATLLESIKKNVKGDYISTVIYKSSDQIFEKGYSELKKRYCNKTTRFVKEQKQHFLQFGILLNLRNAYRYLKTLIKQIELTDFKFLVEDIVEKSPCNYIAFLTDDSVFYKEFDIPRSFLNDDNLNGLLSTFSMRLGLNTIDNKNLKFKKTGSDYYSWDYYSLKSQISSHYNYPFSVDGNIYNRDALLATVKKVFYYNPNTFESYTVYSVRKLKSFNNGICYEHSSLVGFELNQVNISNNNHFNISIRDLNTWFLKNYSMSYVFDSENVTAFRPFLEGIKLENLETSDSIFIPIIK
jgi:hypothetical protein